MNIPVLAFTDENRLAFFNTLKVLNRIVCPDQEICVVDFSPKEHHDLSKILVRSQSAFKKHAIIFRRLSAKEEEAFLMSLSTTDEDPYLFFASVDVLLDAITAACRRMATEMHPKTSGLGERHVFPNRLLFSEVIAIQNSAFWASVNLVLFNGGLNRISNANHSVFNQKPSHMKYH